MGTLERKGLILFLKRSQSQNCKFSSTFSISRPSFISSVFATKKVVIFTVIFLPMTLNAEDAGFMRNTNLSQEWGTFYGSKKNHIDALRALVSATLAFARSLEDMRMYVNAFSTVKSSLSVCMSQHGIRTGPSNFKCLNATQTGKRQQSNDV